MNTFGRILLSFSCLCISVTLSTLIILSFVGPLFLEVILRLTAIFALPVWFLYLPFVIALKNAEQWRIWVILGSGIVIEPASLAVFGLIRQLRGGDAHMIWIGDGLDWGLAPLMVTATIVGVWSAAFYVTVLKVIHLRTATLHLKRSLTPKAQLKLG